MILLFGIHCHQPVGNFEFVFEDVYEKAYKPFIETASRCPWFRFSLHFTGVLWEWIENKHPEFMEMIRDMVNRKQVEILSGAFYEAILSVIPSSNRIGQISMLNDFIKDRFGVKPIGMWLAERVWSPDIVRDIASAGISYTLVDDFHFAPILPFEDSLKGYYLTEYDGKKIAVFPISKDLRYYIPFRSVDSVFSYFGKRKGDTLTIFDDGEKFGSWPNTYDWVYKKGWLEDFLIRLRDERTVSTLHFAEVLLQIPPTGRCYLPVTSYFEMGKWSLPAEVQTDFSKARKILEEGKIRYASILRGGIWQNFLIKYLESNWMHKRVLGLTDKVVDNERAKRCVYKAECNDAYWHGVFGGVYLPHLRHAVYRNIIEAENLVGRENGLEISDVDYDGFDEVAMTNDDLIVYVKPSDGGAVVELDDRHRMFNYLDTIARRFESYHVSAEEDESSVSEEGVPSIHNIKKVKREKEFYYDALPRYAFREYAFKMVPSAGELYKGAYDKNMRFEGGFYVHKGYPIFWKHIDRDVILKKRYGLEGSTLEVNYLIRNLSAGEKELVMGVEINLSFPEIDGVSILCGGESHSLMEFLDIEGSGVEFRGNNFDVYLESDRRFVMCYHPVYTFFQTEYGFDKVLQCGSVWLNFLLLLKSGNSNRIKVRLNLG